MRPFRVPYYTLVVAMTRAEPAEQRRAPGVPLRRATDHRLALRPNPHVLGGTTASSDECSRAGSKARARRGTNGELRERAIAIGAERDLSRPGSPSLVVAERDDSNEMWDLSNVVGVEWR
jgi:hypothetical protein